MDKVLSESYVERFTREKNQGRGVSQNVDILPQEPVEEQNAEKEGETDGQTSRSEGQTTQKVKSNKRGQRNSRRS